MSTAMDDIDCYYYGWRVAVMGGAVAAGRLPPSAIVAVVAARRLLGPESFVCLASTGHCRRSTDRLERRYFRRSTDRWNPKVTSTDNGQTYPNGGFSAPNTPTTRRTTSEDGDSDVKSEE